MSFFVFNVEFPNNLRVFTPLLDLWWMLKNSSSVAPFENFCMSWKNMYACMYVCMYACIWRCLQWHRWINKLVICSVFISQWDVTTRIRNLRSHMNCPVTLLLCLTAAVHVAVHAHVLLEDLEHAGILLVYCSSWHSTPHCSWNTFPMQFHQLHIKHSSGIVHVAKKIDSCYKNRGHSADSV